VLEPVLLEKVWGGDRLARFGFDVATGARIGEAWLAADLGTTSASGAGGGAFRSVIANGALAGRTLRDAAAAFGGLSGGLAADDEFPLLVKLLDAREHLSVQVHPSPAYAAAHPAARLKTECWLVLQAEPGAELFLGLQDGVTRDDVARLVREERLVEALVRVPAVPGECHTLPSGLVHALGAGVLVAEVQTASDTTFRLYDWAREYARPPRALHVAESLAAMLPAARAETRRATPDDPTVAQTDAFAVGELRLEAGAQLGRSGEAPAVVAVVLEGSGTLWEPSAVRLGPGATILSPTGDLPLEAAAPMRLLVASLPVA
jgi:mannose-6-phosphate isomerase